MLHAAIPPSGLHVGLCEYRYAIHDGLGKIGDIAGNERAADLQGVIHTGNTGLLGDPYRIIDSIGVSRKG